jgi:hypothetical protein
MNVLRVTFSPPLRTGRFRSRFSDEFAEMDMQARQIASCGDQADVKIR